MTIEEYVQGMLSWWDIKHYGATSCMIYDLAAVEECIDYEITHENRREEVERLEAYQAFIINNWDKLEKALLIEQEKLRQNSKTS